MNIVVKFSLVASAVVSLIGAGWLAAKISISQQSGVTSTLQQEQATSAAKKDKKYYESLLYTAKFEARTPGDWNKKYYFTFLKDTQEPQIVGECSQALGFDASKQCAIVEGGYIIAFDEATSSAVATTSFNYGGTGRMTTIYFINAQGITPVISQPFTLGDREEIDSANLVANVLTLKMTVHGPSDPMCCPTKKVTRKYMFDGTMFKKT